MEQYTVTGMSCAACSARVEKAVSKVSGVTSCSVSLLTNSMGVEGTAAVTEIVKAVEHAGYKAALKGENKETTYGNTTAYQEDMLKDRETPILKTRLYTSLGFLLILMYLSMGHMMWNWPLPSFLSENYIALGILQLLLTMIVMVINQKFFISGFQSLFHGAPNMDTLVALGSSAAFLYSTYALFLMTDAQIRGDMKQVMAYMHEFYFESAAMILALITVGKMLEAHSKGKTTDALKGLMKLAPKTATILINNVETEVPIEQVKKGDIFVVRPGENIPVDGIVLHGNSAVNEAALTGESIPVDKAEKDKVSAATLNQSGFLTCEAVRIGEDTTLSQIIKMVSDAAATKAKIAKAADKISSVFVPAVMIIAGITILIWLLTGAGLGFSLARGISVLVISCPCALGLATPVAIMVGNGIAAKNGVMFKTAQSLEETGKTQIVALDKTGTITKGEPQVTDLFPAKSVTEKQLLFYASILEKKSEHPLAIAILSYMETLYPSGIDMKIGNIFDFKALPGNGLSASYLDLEHALETDSMEASKNTAEVLLGGNAEFISKQIALPKEFQEKAKLLAQEGKTPLFFAKNGNFLGMIAVADTIKEDSSQAIKELQDMGIYVVMLTGDNEWTAKAIGKQAGVDEVIAGVLPDGKETMIRSLKQKGKTIMVGDGINDAPALTRADIGIAIGAGTDIAIDAADIVLMKSRLSDVPAAIRLSRAVLRNIYENLFWAFIYNIIGIPLAAGIWIYTFGLKLNPMFAAAAMSLSSFCVVTNALRLNLFNMHDARKDKKIKNKKKKEMEENSMKKTMKIEGMMCEHCEARVKKCLEALSEVEEAIVSHESGTASVTLHAKVEDEVLKKAVEDQDYKVISII